MIYYRIEEGKDGFRFCEPERNPDYNRKTESVFAQCNGYLGVRASFETKQLEESRGTFIGGLYHRAGAHEVTELVNCPDVTEFRIRLNGKSLYLDTSRLISYERSLHTRYGELESRIECSMDSNQDAGKICIRSKRFASMQNKNLFCHQFSISCEKGGILELSTGINGQAVNSGVSHFDRVEARVFENSRMFMECGCEDGQILSVMSRCTQKGKNQAVSFHLERRSVWQDFKGKLEPGETCTICKYTLFDTSGAGRDLAHVLNEASSAGYEELYQRHRESFDRFWDMASIKIGGASKEERAAVEFAEYHLAGMAPWESCDYSVAAKGLTGEGYKGHVFWDTEIYIMPFFTMMFPEVTRNLLLYRYKGLTGAREKAREYGYLGAMYPWETAVTGLEETPLYAAMDIHTGKAAKVWSGIKEHHVTADIIYGLLEYFRMTGDKGFMEDYGYEMILETAMFWCSRALWNENRNRMEIRDVIGPDEYTEHVDNNAYTNYMAYENVKAARQVLETWNSGRADACRKQGWETAFDNFLKHIYLPGPNEDHIIPQDDTFLSKKKLPDIQIYREGDVRQLILKDYSRSQVVDMQVLKQADVVMLLELLPDYFDSETIKKNVEFYEALTTHDSSLSQCAHAEAEALAGELDLAAGFFEKAMEIDLREGYKDSADGIHAASLGGILNCVLRGFAGLRSSDTGVNACAHLPEHWKSIECSVMDHGVRKRIRVTKDGAEITAGDRDETGIYI
ncbi:glycoside hydrolase family 65 protein [Clostridium sp. MCC353]|uniref:glycoside hydrolase family 65 protein n=1 Tax=Clostridium sp. MCC353 TaxID=2592646 RepID=UPI001C02EAD5|nr:glycoside hydrolase family 65 protein [Clostridium sp. MCC353]MBT9774942.1 glycoside hydrolase family 65 protein [Clostridium sp. MCC353]